MANGIDLELKNPTELKKNNCKYKMWFIAGIEYTGHSFWRDVAHEINSNETDYDYHNPLLPFVFAYVCKYY